DRRIRDLGYLLEPALGSLDRLVELVEGHDLDVPADQFAGQANVLAAAADGQRQLIFLDEDDGSAEPRIEEYLLDGRRLQGVGDHDLERVVPTDDVDAFAAELVHNVFDARAADADAGADAIHLQVDARHGDLGAVASLAGDGLDLDGAVLDLGDLVLEQPA